MAKPDFEQKYPALTRWVDEYGWIEMGQLDGPAPFIWALNEGGVIWEGEDSYRTLDEAFRDAEKGIAAWLKENIGDDE